MGPLRASIRSGPLVILVVMRRWLVALRDSVRAGAGYLVFRSSAREPAWGVRGLRGLFTAHPDLPRRMGRVTTVRHRSRLVRPAPTGVLAIDTERLATVSTALGRDGFYVFPDRLDSAIVDALLGEGRALPRLASVDQGSEAILFDQDHVVSSRYLCGHRDLVNSAIVQTMLSDPTFPAIADAYLGCDCVQCDVGLWQSVVHDDGSRDAASQRFHSDRDHLQFLKFFVYLTDVDADTGPHVFVRGSHRSRPVPLRRDIRYSDEQVADWYRPDDVVELIGPRGTVIAVDTSGLHKGKPPTSGERWIFELEYSSSLYGPGGIPMQVDRAIGPFIASLASQPRRYARFTLSRTVARTDSPVSFDV